MKRSRDAEAILISSDSECDDLVDGDGEDEDDDDDDDAYDNSDDDDYTDDEEADDDDDDEDDDDDDDNDDDDEDDDYNTEETDVDDDDDDDDDNVLSCISERVPDRKARKRAFSGSSGDRDVESIKEGKKKTRCKQGLKKGGENAKSKTVLSGEDQKLFAEALNIIRGGDLEMLKLEYCKAYLRHYSLRLTGSKITLLDRVREHVELKACGGMAKYPSSTFTINCTGDACRGDVVLFKQKVKIYKKACRNSTHTILAKRIVAGRIVKESYGSDKQQHTFTVEVLWSKGPKALPLLYPLLIKGRNLYRLKTLRQRWPNEEERKTVLQEKHSRGDVARNARENRVSGKRNSWSKQMGLSKREARINLKRKRASGVSAQVNTNAIEPSSFRGNARNGNTSKEIAFRQESMVSRVVSSHREYENRFCRTFRTTMCMLDIQACFAGLLIGSKGRNIGAIARASGARVQICENPLNPTSRLVEITGIPEQVQVATGKVMQTFLDRGLPPPVVITQSSGSTGERLRT